MCIMIQIFGSWPQSIRDILRPYLVKNIKIKIIDFKFSLDNDGVGNQRNIHYNRIMNNGEKVIRN